MVKTTSTSFRFDKPFLDLLERLEDAHGLSKTAIVRQSVLIWASMLGEAHGNALGDLAALQSRYGEEAVLICTASVGPDGTPVGSVTVDGRAVDDVRVRPWVDMQAGVAHMFLEVLPEGLGELPNLIPFGDEHLLLSSPPRMQLGKLPWPPKRSLGIQGAAR